MSTSYTSDQEKVVMRVLSCKTDSFYEILECERTSTELQIKKSYRKLAVKLHPDKNSHPRASEAFKHLNKAWGVLSDPSKKRIYDQTGADPDSRFASSATSADMFETNPFGRTSGFQEFQGFQGSNIFEDDIFNLFFGGGGPSGTTFTFGGNNGFTFQSFGGGDPFFGPRRRTTRQRTTPGQPGRREEEETGFTNTLRQLLPIFIFLLVPLISSLFSDPTPEFSFQKTRQFNMKRQTPNHKIPFYVAKKFEDKNLSKNQKKAFDLKVERNYISDTRSKCSKEHMVRNSMLEDAQGWFYTDEKMLNEAQNYPMPNCAKLNDLNLDLL